MADFTVKSADLYAKRVISTFPTAWGASTSFQSGGNYYEFIKATCVMFVGLGTMLQYAVAQMRITTAYAENLDQISSDYFGSALPRLPSESDSSFRARIKDALISARTTRAAIQAACDFYIAYLYTQASGSTIVPTVNVFDRQDNPTASAAIQLPAGSFVVELDYATPIEDGWLLGMNYLGYDTYLLYTVPDSIDSTVDPNLANIVNLYKAEGTQPEYQEKVVLTP